MKLVVLLVLMMCSITLSAQLSVTNTADDLLPINLAENVAKTAATPPDLKHALLGSGWAIQTSSFTPTNLQFNQHLAFFCRIEAKNDKAAKMPVRFRLGSVDYVDYLEGKRDYTPRQ